MVIIMSCHNLPFVNRTEWGSDRNVQFDKMVKLKPPLEQIVFIATGVFVEETLEALKRQVRTIQHQHMTNRGWDDIGYK